MIPTDKRSPGSKLFDKIFSTRNLDVALCMVFTLMVLVWVLSLVRKNQLGPHTVRSYIVGKEISEFTTTNPAYVTLTWAYVYTNGAAQMVPKPQTNYYWRVWSIFK